MKLPCTDYELLTTFWMDFSIADRSGTKAVKDTFDRAFAEWKDNYVYLTELVMILNHKTWQWYENDDDLSKQYDGLYQQASAWAEQNLTGEALSYYYQTTD